jgi:PAS domain S-box-containing protein
MKKNIGIMKSKYKTFCLLLLILSVAAIWLSSPSTILADHSNVKKVLIVNSYHYGFKWSDDEMQGFISKLPEGIDIFTEFMDTKRDESPAYYQMLLSSFQNKYRHINFDLIVTMDDPAFQFVLAHRQELFPDVPLIFLGVNNFKEEFIANQQNITGVVEVNDFNAINTAIQLYPQATQVFVISDQTLSGQANRAAIESLIDDFIFPVPVIFLDTGTGLNANELLNKTASIPPASIIYYADFFREANGDYVDYKDFLPKLSKAANAPIFAHAGMYLGYGITGGKLGSGYLEGQSAGLMANRILSGESADAIPINSKGSSQYQFDYLQLQRWGISLSKLPDNSKLINQQTTFYEQNKVLFWGFLSFLVIQTSIILLLLVSISQKKNAEAQLRESESRYRSIFEESPSIQIIVEPMSGQIFAANPAAVKFYGYSLQELTTMPITSIDMRSNDTVFEILKSISKGEVNQFICKHRLRNGELRDVELFTGPITINQTEYIFGTIHDVTDRMEREREMEIISQLAIDLRKVEETSEIFNLLLNFATTTAYSESTILAWKNNFDQEYRVVGTKGETKIDESAILPNIALISNVIDSRKAEHLNYSEEISEINLLFSSLQNKFVSIVPLLTSNNVVGLLIMKSKWILSQGDIRSLSTVCEIVASSLLRSRLFDETELQVQRLNALHIIDKAITTNTRLELTLDVVLDQVTKQLDIDAARVMLYQPSTLTLETAKAIGFKQSDLAMRPCRIGIGLSGQVAAERQTILIPDIMADGSQIFNNDSNSIINNEFFQAYFGAPLISKGQIIGILELFNRTPINVNHEWVNFFEALARQATIAVDEATLFEDLERTNIELTLAYDTTLEGWARALELRDYETKGHSQRVTDLTVQLARALNVTEQEIGQIRRGALLHDIGKMGIPDHILHKPGPLTSEEWEIMQKHPIYAFEMLSRISYLRPALDIPYYHHEKWDGSGYPFGLKGTQIPLPARIFAIVDVWDALASDRPYRKAWTKDRITSYMLENSGTHFDPNLVAIFLEKLKEVEDLLEIA